MKAFLSHSSEDAEFVGSVAGELGRQFTWLDSQQFRNGDEFLATLEKGIVDSGVFVLFASAASLSSIFVNFEITEARRQLVAKAVRRVLVFIIDPSITYRDLPAWLQRCRTETAVAPVPVARIIRQALDEASRERQRNLFVGRTQQLKALEAKLLPTDGSPPPRTFLVTGLPGIGRRTLVDRIAKDHWNIRRLVQVRVESGDSLADLAAKLANHFEVYNTLDALKEICRALLNEEKPALTDRVVQYIRSALGGGELITLIDEGGLLDNDARSTELMRDVLEILESQADLYAALVARRRPTWPEDAIVGLPPTTNVPPLSDQETKQLVAALCTRDGIRVDGDKISALGEAAAGYPPSAFHIVELVKDYGYDVALRDPQRLASSRLGPLTRYLKTIELSDVERWLLRLLASCSPLPFPLLGELASVGPEGVAKAVARLIDACLIVPDEDGYYWLADPIRDVVIRELRDLSRDEYALTADSLERYLRSTRGEVPPLELARVLYRVHTLAHDSVHREAAFALSSDMLDVAERLYHRREYTRAIDFARQVLTVRPRNYDARYILCRALIKTGEFDRAAGEIDRLRDQHYSREAAFLGGFLERHRDNPRGAIDKYERAIQRGYQGMAVHRELAQCYLALNDVAQAKRHIELAARTGRDNRFVVDLEVRIAIQEGDEAAARSKLALLEQLDDSAFYHHRASTFHAAFGRQDEALTEARECLSLTGRPTLAMLSQITLCELRSGNLDEAAATLTRLDRDFPGLQSDVRLGLHCQLEIARRQYQDALGIWSRLTDKSKPVPRALRRSVLAGLLRGALPDATRFAYQREIDEINSELAGRSSRELEVVLPE